MNELLCECGNDGEFREETIVTFTVDSERNREYKEDEVTNYFCQRCGKEFKE